MSGIRADAVLFEPQGFRMMHDDCMTRVEKVWLATSLTAFLLHRLLEAERILDGMWLLEALMLLLTFPFGWVVMFFLAIADEVFGSSAEISWLIDWSTLLVVGYIQWFWVLPEIRRNSQLITLNLSTPIETASPVETAARVETALPVAPVSTAPPPDGSLIFPELASPPPPPPATAPVVFNVADFPPPFAEFDEAGLTTLDRVLRAEILLAPPATTASPSTVESIFPAARRLSRA